MEADGEAAAEEQVVAEQNDEALVEATEEEQFHANPSNKTTINTPTKRPARSTCWESTRRLTSDHPKAKENGSTHTHVYTEEGCLYFYTLVKPAGEASGPATRVYIKASTWRRGGGGTEYIHMQAK